MCVCTHKTHTHTRTKLCFLGGETHYEPPGMHLFLINSLTHSRSLSHARTHAHPPTPHPPPLPHTHQQQSIYELAELYRVSWLSLWSLNLDLMRPDQGLIPGLGFRVSGFGFRVGAVSRELASRCSLSLSICCALTKAFLWICMIRTYVHAYCIHA